jgi:tetratricopeptide (TPR) repeat protein
MSFEREAPAAKSKREQVGESDPLGPIGEAMTDSLEMLAIHVMEGSSLDATADALAAMESQRQGYQDEAIAAYLRTENKLRHPALKLNLGGLLLLRDRPEEAVRHLNEAVQMPQLTAGALHGLGQAYSKQGKQKQAVRFLLQSLQAVDTSLAVDAEEASELNSVYGS